MAADTSASPKLRGPDVEASITFLRTTEGGRSGPVNSTYRAAADFGVSGEFNDVNFEFPEDVLVELGRPVRGLLTLLWPERNAGRLHPGFKFTIHEGRKLVARGEITRILNNTVRRNA